MSNRHHPPMLLIPADEEGTWNIYNILDNKLLDLQVTVPSNYKQFCGSSKGWLIATDEKFGVALINPFSRIKGREEKENSIIQLPPLIPSTTPYYWSIYYEHYLLNATISADPILYPDDCIVVVTLTDYGELAFIRVNKDTRWTDIGERPWTLGVPNLFSEVVYVQDKFYVVDCFSKLLSFDITSRFNSDVKLIASGLVSYGNIYLVDTNENELLMIQRLVTFPGDYHKRRTTEFRVWGFDVEKVEWIEKERCKPDCIYFNDDRDPDQLMLRKKPCDFGVYNFKTRKFSLPYNTCAKNLLKRSKRFPIWILPTFQL